MSLPRDVVADGAAPHTPSTFTMSQQPQLAQLSANVKLPLNMATRSDDIITRLDTFRQTNLSTKFQLASAGFSYDEKSRIAKCLLCGCTAPDGVSDPLALHMQKSPRCSFVTFNKSAAIPTSLPPAVAAPPAAAPEAKKSPASLPSPKYRQFQEHAARLVTYQGWPLQVVQQSPEYLAKCGLFYIGSADRVRCFFCGITLRNWEAEDDPYEEHKNWAPRCTFIQTLPRPERNPVTTLGETRQDEADSKANHSCSEASPLPQPHHHQHHHGAHQQQHGESTDCSSSQSSSGSHQSKPSAPGASDAQVGSGASDIMSSPSVLAVIDMGFERSVVERVVLQEEAKGSSRVSSAVELFTAVEEYLSCH